MKKEKIAIIGSGMIGISFAALFTGNGYETRVLSRTSSSVDRGRQQYSNIYKTLLSRKLLTEEYAQRCLKLLFFTEKYEDLSNSQVVFECASENIETKFNIFRQVEKHCPKIMALASTTSALSADDLSGGLTIHKEKFLVAHPFNPPHLVPFVECVRSEKTSDDATRLVFNILESTGRKVSIMKKGAPGFIANRLQHALLREAIYMIEQGYVTARDIDQALMYSFMPRYTSVGLFEHQDAAGLDLVCNIQNYLFPYLSEAKKASIYLRDKVDSGKMGQKTGEGIYAWSQEQKENFAHRAADPYWKYFNWNLKDLC